MKQKNSILVLIFSLVFSFFFFSGELFAYSKNDLKKLIKTKKCVRCDLFIADLSEANLIGVILIGANLKNANLKNTNLNDLDINYNTISTNKIF